MFPESGVTVIYCMTGDFCKKFTLQQEKYLIEEVPKALLSKIKQFASENSDFEKEEVYIYWKYLDDNENNRICLSHFSCNLISPQYRKMIIQRLIDEIEAFINEVLKYKWKIKRYTGISVDATMFSQRKQSCSSLCIGWRLEKE